MSTSSGRPLNSFITRHKHENAFRLHDGRACQRRGPRLCFGAVQVALLGSLVVTTDQCDVALGAAKQRAVIELLALRAGRPVSVESLCAGLWGDSPPISATKALQTYVSQLRRVLPPHCLATVGDGYALVIEAGSVDATRFEEALRHSAELRGTGKLAAAVGALAEGLQLWRGRPCPELTEHSWATAEVVRLEELRRGADEDLADTRLALGQHAQVVGDLEAAVAAEPLRERRWAQLMLALYRSGRQADALPRLFPAAQEVGRRTRDRALARACGPGTVGAVALPGA